MEITPLIHYLTISATITLPAVSVGFGQSFAAQAVIKAMNRQPAAKHQLTRIFFIGMALMETAGVLSTLMGVMLFMSPMPTYYGVIAQLGSAIAIALPAMVIGIASSLPTKAAFKSVARQPIMSQKLMNLLLISLSILQTPVIFGLIIGWLIQQQVDNITTLAESLKLLASGLALAIGSIGPTIGLTTFSQQACKSAGSHPQSYDSILSFTFLSQALIETPILFALVVALFLNFTALPIDSTSYTGLVSLVAAFVIGFTTLGTGISSGRTAREACVQIGHYPEHYSALSRSSILAQTLIDTNAIYGLIIALLMLFSLTA